jgi:hypothetical protein
MASVFVHTACPAVHESFPEPESVIASEGEVTSHASVSVEESPRVSSLGLVPKLDPLMTIDCRMSEVI